MWQEFKSYTDLDRKKLIRLFAYPFYQLCEWLAWFGNILVGDVWDRLHLVRMLLAGPVILAVEGLDKLEKFILSFTEGKEEEGE